MHEKKGDHRTEVADSKVANVNKSGQSFSHSHIISTSKIDIVRVTPVSQVKPAELYSDLEIAQAVNKSGVCNAVGLRIPLKSNWNIELFWQLCTSRADREVALYLLYGWPLNRDNGPVAQTIGNHKSALNYPQEVTAYIMKEIRLGAMIGPFVTSPFPHNITGISPMSSRSKKNSTSRRIIVDLSWPPDATGSGAKSVNSLISKDKYMDVAIKLQYPTIDMICKRILQLGPKIMGYRKDMRRAFRQIRHCPTAWSYLSVTWMGALFHDKSTVMGCVSAPYICQKTTGTIRHFMQNIEYDIFNYIDDFMGIDVIQKIWASYNTLGNLLRDLGVQEAPEKSVPPTTVIELLGIIFDLIRMIMIIPEEKMTVIQKEIEVMLSRTFVSKKQLQRLAGRLQFAALCVRPGRVFVTRLYDKIGQMDDGQIVKMDQETIKDVQWWQKYMHHYNGVLLMWLEQLEDTAFGTDASLTGIGGKCQNQYFKHKLIVSKDTNIAHLEMLALIIGLKLWIKELTGTRIQALCDNMAVLEVVNRGRAKDKTLQKYLRELTYILATNHAELRIVYIASRDNLIPDILSRYYTDINMKNKLEKLLEENPTWEEVQVSESILNNICDW